MHVEAICAFSLTFWYASSRSIFPIKMIFYGHLKHMNEIIWIILKSVEPQLIDCPEVSNEMDVIYQNFPLSGAWDLL